MTLKFYVPSIPAILRGTVLICLVILSPALQPRLLHAASLSGPLPGNGGLLTTPPPLGAETPGLPLPAFGAPPPDERAPPKISKPAPIANPAPIILSAGDLADLCAGKPSDRDGIANRNICTGFMLGIIAVAERQQAGGGVKMFCTPNPIFDIADALDRFALEAKTQPAIRSAPVVDGLIQFLQQHFPCK